MLNTVVTKIQQRAQSDEHTVVSQPPPAGFQFSFTIFSCNSRLQYLLS